MDYEQIRKDFEKWRKKFLERHNRSGCVNDKRRDLEPTGNESPPDVYRKTESFRNALENQLRMQNQAYMLTPGYLLASQEDVQQIITPIAAGRHIYNEMYRHKPKQDSHIIIKDDVINIKISLEKSKDINDFIKEM